LANPRKRKSAKRGRGAVSKAKGVSPESPPSPSPKLAKAVKEYSEQFNARIEREKPRLLSLLLCGFSNFTIDKKVNLLGVFDRIYVPPENKRTPVFTLFVRTAEAIEEPLAVTLFTPDNKLGMAFQFGGEPQVYTPGLPAQVQLAIGIQFIAEVQGPYWFDISYKGISLGGAGLVVEHRAMEEKHGGTDTYI